MRPAPLRPTVALLVASTLLAMPAHAEVVEYELRARPEGPAPFSYSYNDTVPGPTLRARVGDTLVVTLHNELDAPTTIHWHGAAVPWAMDGVTWMNTPVMPGETFVYTFDLTHAGTLWYHPHFDTGRQVDAGLYGLLIVEDPADPAASELTFVFDTADEHLDPAPRHAHGRAVLAPTWLVNGQPTPHALPLPAGSVQRVRILNASNHGYLSLRAPDLRQIAGEQGLLPSVQTPRRVVLGPGQRAELEWRVFEAFTLETERYSLNGGASLGDPLPLVDVVVEGAAPQPDGLPWPFPGGEVSPDPPYADIVYALAGSDRTGDWRINGESFPEVTVEEVPLGAEVIVEVRNLSPTEHPFHLHGHHFEVLSVNGRARPYRTIADTWNLAIRDRVRLRFIADNPGDWMTHCHILPHAGEGMMTVLRVRDP